MEKREYITNQFKKTFHKKYENYCISRIYHKLDMEDLIIVTQQLFKRDNNKIALADLYLPQLKMFIEIDEPQHLDLKHQEEDKKRTEEIIKNKIKGLEEIVNSDKLVEERIILTKNITLNEINNQIDKLIIKIKKMIIQEGEKFYQFNIENKPVEYYIRKGFIETDDNAKFRTVHEISNLFNKGYKKGSMNVYFKINSNENIYAWCPILKLNDDECKTIPYDNEQTLDGHYIFESSKQDNEEFVNKVLNNSEKRYVFTKYKDETGQRMYKFKGIFTLDRDLTIQTNKRAWKKIGEKVYLSDYFNKN